ncbi:hypothetical protein IC006_0466 [Sulfuracidifex tepidarius]|uniref:Methyltransferase FkbM domain-containing protein n=1 Tax=Sulfuracidifex tepidarius TaxID=1294262 RepID=A0A510DSL8_9CREN|nr:FkbM family methyltransferase [Sulfuracidifex tepidarius]BBG23182.1 hypothetical protein IC006_0466 [Sulfuracidifex tepidarius]
MKSLTSAIARINTYRRIFDNWLYVVTKVRNGERSIEVKLKDKSKGICTINCIVAVVDLVNKFDFDPLKLHFKERGLYYNNNFIVQDSYLSTLISAGGFEKEGNLWYNRTYNIRFINRINSSLFENFSIKQYNNEIEGEVVDIGANIGDSAIYFALKGASHVYAFEPLPDIYGIALQNIKINHLENKITLANAAVGSKEGKVKVPLNINTEESGGFSITDQGDVEIPMLSFNNVTKMVKDHHLLKIDCEGCEADIIMSSELDFDKIFLESHQRITKISHKKLIRKLEEQNYKCEETMEIDNDTKIFYCIKSK